MTTAATTSSTQAIDLIEQAGPALTRICHIVDASAGWEQRVAIEQLLDRLPCDTFEQYVVATHPNARVALGPIGSEAVLILSRLGLTVLAAPRLRGFLARSAVDVIHAWGTSAALAALAACDKPIVVELFDPVAARRDVKLLRTLAESGHVTVATGCAIVRRRLIEGGFETDRTVVIRPGVDFSRINAYRRSTLRADLGVPTADTLVCLVPPVTRRGGHFEACYAVSVINHVTGRHHVIVPDRSRETRRIKRFQRGLPMRHTLVFAGDRISVEALIAVSDVLLITGGEDVPTTSIAWAMASRTAVVAAASYAVTEMVVHKVNGLLFKQTPGRSMLPSIARCLGDRATLDRVREAAHGQAYEIFGLRRYVEDHVRLYENVLDDRAAGAGIVDSAQV